MENEEYGFEVKQINFCDNTLITLHVYSNLTSAI